jgi:hypothetical protein
MYGLPPLQLFNFGKIIKQKRKGTNFYSGPFSFGSHGNTTIIKINGYG